MITVVGGGQSGADFGAWLAAEDKQVKTCGWMAPGYLCEDAAHPEYAKRFGAKPIERRGTPGQEYRWRSIENVKDSDGTLCFDAVGSQASQNAQDDCKKYGKPFLGAILQISSGGRLAVVEGFEVMRDGYCSPVRAPLPPDVARWIIDNKIQRLNCAGNRESKAPGIQAYVQRYMTEVIRQLRMDEPSPGLDPIRKVADYMAHFLASAGAACSTLEDGHTVCIDVDSGDTLTVADVKAFIKAVEALR